MMISRLRKVRILVRSQKTVLYANLSTWQAGIAKSHYNMSPHHAKPAHVRTRHVTGSQPER